MSAKSSQPVYHPSPTKVCKKCGEELPATTAFYFSKAGKYGRWLSSPCKACIAEQAIERRDTRPCIVPGCDQPRAYVNHPRCRKHYAENVQQRRSRNGH